MSLFSNMNTEGHEEQQDRLGGFQPLDTDAYDATIKLAYASQSPKGARAVNFEFDLGNNKSYKETIYVTTKDGENFYMSKQDKKMTLPGWITVDNICLVTTEKPLSQQETEDKVVNVYDPEAKKDVPKSVPVLVELLGKPVTIGVINQLVNQNEKDGQGGYVATAKTRNENNIDAVFHAESKMTVVEARNGQASDFYAKWVERNKGQVRDRTDKALASAGGNAGAPQAGAGGGARKSLFGG